MRLLKVILALPGILVPLALLYFEKLLSGYSIGIALACYCLSSAIHLLAHECGHFLGGMISGYRLLCLQLGPIRIVKNQENKLKIQWHGSLRGQCIMIPKNVNAVRFLAYNLGGVFANLVVVAVCFGLLMLDWSYATVLFATFLCIGIQKTLINLLPYTANSTPNDGYIVRLLHGKAAVRKDYAMYLELYGKLFSGEPVSPEDYRYPREQAQDTRELLYYNEIQQILQTLETERV